MLFSFVVRKLGFLKSIPLFAQIFDNIIKIWMLITNSSILDQIDKIEAVVLDWSKTSTSLHKFGGIQFNYEKEEFAHIHSNGILDILFTRQVKAELISKNKVQEHHLFKKSGWITFYITKEEDVATAISLLKLAYLKIASH